MCSFLRHERGLVITDGNKFSTFGWMLWSFFHALKNFLFDFFSLV